MRILKELVSALLLFSAFDLDAGILQHLKKAEGKSGTHSMRNIDFIYVINLDQRPKKLKQTLNQLAPFGIFPYRFSAVNGWELSLETINDVGVKFSPEMEGGFLGTCFHRDGSFQPRDEIIQNIGQTYFCHSISRGTIGIALSHISILQDAVESGYETIWVMEDDIQVIRDPNILSDLIDQLDQTVGKGNWDILFTDRDTKGASGNYVSCYSAAARPDFMAFTKINDYRTRTVVNDNFYKIGARYGAYSMIVSSSGIKKLLRFFKAHQIFLPYDMDFTLPQGIQLYTVAHDIVSTIPDAPTDNGRCGYILEK